MCSCIIYNVLLDQVRYRQAEINWAKLLDYSLGRNELMSFADWND